MTIKPVKAENSESEGTSQHRECLNKIASPKSPNSHNVIDQRNSLRNNTYSVEEVVVNRHRRNNPKSGSSHCSNNSNTQKHHKQRLISLNSCNSSPSNSTCASDSSNSNVLNVPVNESDLLSNGSNAKSPNTSNPGAGNALSSTQSTSSHVIINNIGSTNNNNNVSNSNSSNSTSSGLKNSPLTVLSNETLNDDDQNSYSGYNSGDEHIGQKYDYTPEEWDERDKLFVKAMAERGLIVEVIAEDGACLFRSISLQIFGDQDMHENIRQQTMDYIYKNREYFAQFVTEDIDSYVSRKRNNHVHGNHIEIQAISEIYNRPVELYLYDTEPANIFGSDQLKNGIEPLRLSYQRGSHYNAILNPYKPTVGLGLGLAGYRITEEAPSVKHLHDAVRLSEDLEIEQTMLEDKLRTTDWEATNEAMEEQIARESYLQWCRENRQAQKQKQNSQMLHQHYQGSLKNFNLESSSTITSSTAAANADAAFGYSAHHRESDDSGSCESIDFYKGDKNDDDLEKTPHMDANYNLNAQYQSRKRRSNRRKHSNSKNFVAHDVPNSGCMSATNYESNCSDDSSPNRKRKVSSPVVPGPSRYNANMKSPPQPQTEESLSEFYHSLLESSFSEMNNANYQLSEEEMIAKALQMSRLEFLQK